MFKGVVAFPAWSPNGRLIAYSSGPRPGVFNQLRIARVDGKGDHVVMRNIPSAGNGHHATWSPDGRELAFQVVTGSRAEIRVVTLATGQVRPLTKGPAPTIAPDWSPNGSLIAFARDSHIGQDICLIRSSGGAVRCLTHAKGCVNGFPDWSPTGKRLVFWSDCAAKAPGRCDAMRAPHGCADIYVINADGTGQRRLTHDPSNADAPVWSPDGKKILFVSKRTGNFQLFVMKPNGTNQHQITHGAGVFATQPSWQPLYRR
jgi:TolB protein